MLAYELVTGKSPWRISGTNYGALAAILSEEPPLLRAVAPSLSVVAAEVIGHALQKDPARRFPTMDAVVSALEPILGGSSPKLPEGGTRSSHDPMLPFLQR